MTAKWDTRRLERPWLEWLADLQANLGGCGKLHTNSASLLGFSGLRWVKLATHLPTVERDKGRSVPLGASGEWLPLLQTGKGRERVVGEVSWMKRMMFREGRGG